MPAIYLLSRNRRRPSRGRPADGCRSGRAARSASLLGDQGGDELGLRRPAAAPDRRRSPRLVGEIEAGLQVDVDAAREDRERDVRRLHPAVAEGRLPGLDGLEKEQAGLEIGGGAAPAGEVVGAILAVGIGLPDLHHAHPSPARRRRHRSGLRCGCARPRVPSRARMFRGSGCCVFSPATAGIVPIWTKGPAVCDGVSLSAISGAPRTASPAAAQHDVEAVGEAVERLHRRPCRAWRSGWSIAFGSLMVLTMAQRGISGSPSK